METQEVTRPWGSFKILDKQEKYWQKIITVKPYQKLSLQYHEHRSEYWVVQSGEGTVQVDDKFYNAKEGSIFFIPIGALHRVINGVSTGNNDPQREDFVFRETAIGKVDEDDIVRVEDMYGR
ncbi:alginate biosynthesis protein [Acanthocystis turfacea Chlorella virus MN0810.1]|nr:alginate biosynthesis protein [Acanthocystis turfacea Chlorella virus MN0810.1]